MIDELIEKLKLEPHPEGGWYRETYRSDETIPISGLPQRYESERCYATLIYFLLTADTFSALHRIQSDEQWHFYSGTGLTIHVIDPDGNYEAIKLGPNLEKGETFQAVVKRGCWFGATVDSADSYALVGCTVAPGFEFDDFQLAERAKLIEKFPQHQELITRLTRITKEKKSAE